MVLGLAALLGSIHAVCLGKEKERHSRRWLLVVGVGLIVAALFPYISATDDVLRIDHEQTQNSHGPGQKHKTDNLMRLYETMDTSIVCRIQPFIFTLIFTAFVTVLVLRDVALIAPATAGRSPPAY